MPQHTTIHNPKKCCIWDPKLSKVYEGSVANTQYSSERSQRQAWSLNTEFQIYQHYWHNDTWTWRRIIRGDWVFSPNLQCCYWFFFYSTQLKTFSRCSTIPASHRLLQNLGFRQNLPSCVLDFQLFFFFRLLRIIVAYDLNLNCIY